MKVTSTPWKSPTVRLRLGEAFDLCSKMPENSVDLVVCSPPYEGLRTYGIDFELWGDDWVDWAFTRFAECLRVCRGPVCWVVNGSTKRGLYSLVPERLAIRLADAGFGVRRSLVYYRIGSMNGGGASKMPRNVYEPILVATREREAPPFADLHDAGTDAVVKTPGGRVSQRRRDGSRVEAGRRVQPSRAILKDVLDVGAVGGGNMGSALATENEAPYSVKVVEPLIRAWCPVGGTVLDPFCGSGTTLSVAHRLGRNSIGFEIRKSQIELTRRRLREDGLVRLRAKGRNEYEN